ncbi:hypothetical protein J5N97_024398 [Dioscorea zingiberensis]|uniref:Uncharacterized protein n=1 Tax=Dioscorea zingiberensis TaxID=325984 RepID=A0A9D5C6B4_9LILI|nr:hypothetical protein J5N97_024398 [Dioscorea zingiberensis]
MSADSMSTMMALKTVVRPLKNLDAAWYPATSSFLAVREQPNLATRHRMVNLNLAWWFGNPPPVTPQLLTMDANRVVRASIFPVDSITAIEQMNSGQISAATNRAREKRKVHWRRIMACNIAKRIKGPSGMNEVAARKALDEDSSSGAPEKSEKDKAYIARQIKSPSGINESMSYYWDQTKQRGQPPVISIEHEC